LARYDRAIDQHLLLATPTQQQAWTNHVNSKGQKLPYGLGWFVQMYGSEPIGTTANGTPSRVYF
jgi:hypothetical protein